MKFMCKGNFLEAKNRALKNSPNKLPTPKLCMIGTGRANMSACNAVLKMHLRSTVLHLEFSLFSFFEDKALKKAKASVCMCVCVCVFSGVMGNMSV